MQDIAVLLFDYSTNEILALNDVTKLTCACHSHIFIVLAVVCAPSQVLAVKQFTLIAGTPDIIQGNHCWRWSKMCPGGRGKGGGGGGWWEEEEMEEVGERKGRREEETRQKGVVQGHAAPQTM